MASLIYNSAPDDIAKNNINFASDVFKCMLVTSSYVPNKDTHTKRSDVTNEVTGLGYTPAGETVSVTITKDLVNDRVDIVFGQIGWENSTITARGAVYYKARGGNASDDEIIAYNDFGVNLASINGLFTIPDSTLRLKNLSDG